MTISNIIEYFYGKKIGQNYYENNGQKPGSTFNQYIAAATINLMMLSYGCFNGWLSPTLLKLQGEDSPSGEPLGDQTSSWMVSTFALAATAATPFYGYMADAYGRKKSLLTLAIPSALSWVLVLGSPSPWSLILSRILGGASAGGGFILIPVYVAETSDDGCRGALGVLLSLENCLGYLLGYLAGGLLDYHVSVAVFLGLPLLYAVVFFRMPETPVYLVKRGKFEEAAKSLAWFRSLDTNDKMILAEIDKLKIEDSYNKSVPKMTLKSVVQNPGNRHGLKIILVLLTIEGWNGTYSLMNYVGTIFAAAFGDSAAVDEATPFARMLMSNTGSSVFVGLVMVLGALAGFILVEKCGRKPLLIGSCATVAVCLTSLGVWFYLKENSPEVAIPGWLPITALSACVFGNSAGIYAVPMVILSEVFTFQVRSALIVAVLVWAWILAFIQLKVFTPLSNLIGFHGLLWMFSVVNVFGVFYTIFFVPETRGRTLDDITKELGYDTKIIKTFEDSREPV